MDTKLYWTNKHKKYSQEDWINRPTFFAQFAINYFPKSGKLLDLGAGQGQDSRFFADRGYSITGTDYSETAIELASNVKSESKIEYLVHDLKDKLPFNNEVFDVVYSHLSIQFFDDEVTESIFSEIYRVLKKGGILAIMVNTKDDPQVAVSKSLRGDLYEAPDGLVKRFYTTQSLANFVSNKFQTILLDSEGETYKDETKTLIRYIGKK